MKTPTFKEFWGQLERTEQENIASAANTSWFYLQYFIAGDRRKPGVELTVKLKRADKRITDAMLRPDLY